MLDFMQIVTKEARGGVVEVRPDFKVGRAKDLMVQGGSFYAVWDEEKGLWSRDEYDVRRLGDLEITEFVEALKADGVSCSPKFLEFFSNGGWKQFKTFLKNVSDNSHPLDAKVTFANTEVKKSDYASRRLPYNLTKGKIKAYDELISLLYSPEERAKFEWAIGAVIAGDAKRIQKFLVFYGAPGTGKSTVMDIVYKLMGGLVKDGGYVAMFDAKALVGNNNSFSTSAFKDNPLVAIQHDGDLSKIEDNTKLNSIVSHENMQINEKYKAMYDTKINALLFMGTNKPVKISDAKSGLVRRLIDVRPTGNKHEVERYNELITQVEFELGAIAYHCLEVYKSMGRNYYNNYRPLDMMLQTDVFFNFIEANFDIFKAQDSTSLKQAWALYKEYCEEAEIEFKLQMHRFREELKSYFSEFHDRITIDGNVMRSYYAGFTAQPFKAPLETRGAMKYSLVLEETTSLFDEAYASCPAQYGKADETPTKYWTDEERMIDGVLKKPRPDQVVSTTLADLDTSKLHFVKIPENHIVIDFDLKGEDGEKSLERNLEMASAWPATYAELSKSGSGVHLHYMYDGGDTGDLASVYSEGIEVKVYRGNGSLRRKLTKCNSIPVATISSGLPFKEQKTMIEPKVLQSEKGLRELIARNLRKEIHPGTKPSIDFIWKILDDANKAGMIYDVTDMRPAIMAFANNSTHQALTCLKIVKNMKFKSDAAVVEDVARTVPKDDRIVLFDCEVYPNLFVVCWKYRGSNTVVRMINPEAKEIEGLLQFKLVGFNNRGYDNHILWARFMGYCNEQLFELSQKIIANDKNAMFGEAYNLSYADIYDFASVKQSLKKWMIQLGLHHMEMDLPWDQPVDPKDIPRVVEYCVNDVNGTEAVLDACEADFQARHILAAMSGLTVNDTTRVHAGRIIFGKDRNPQEFFNYTDLSGEFPGYVYDYGTSTYRGEVVGEGGYVYAEPGMYENVALLDVASMHPTSIIQLDLFGKYTNKFTELYMGRLAVKHANEAWKKAAEHPEQEAEFLKKAEKFVKEAKEWLPGIEITKENAKALADALKLVINSIYGYTSATFPNLFRDPRNKDNIVAKRGALFMIDLKHFIQDHGFQVAHIKTDSVKIPNATPEIIEAVMEFGKRYGYTFEHEKTFQKFCLVNDAVYVARSNGKWDTVGAQFQHPVVRKALFTHEPIKFEDLCETKQVSSGSAMYLDFDESQATPNNPYKGMHFIGRVGMFLPVHEHVGGAKLVRVKDGKSYAVTGTKGYLWLEAEMVRQLKMTAIDRLLFEDLTDAINGTGSLIDIVNMGYYESLVDDAMVTLEKFGDYYEFVTK
jgi:hypothetical protein